jgi:signal transduction histidine kinase/ligand-binding sensor domain-containing protein/DNA-binding response OmpR family regulator
MPTLRQTLHWFCILGWALFFPPKANAQPTGLKFDHLTTEDGLSNSSIHCILQDRDGFMWFGTGNGLNRYDGYSFKIYKHLAGDTTTLTDNIVNSLYEDRQERLWVGTDFGLHLYDRARDQFIRIPGPVVNGRPVARIIKAMLEDRRGNFWIGTDGGGFYRFDREERSFTHYAKEGTYHGQNSVQHLFEDSQGNLWVGTFGGLFLFDAEELAFTHFANEVLYTPEMIKDYVWSIAEDQEGRLWIGTIESGLYLFDPEQASFRPFHRILDKNIYSLHKDTTGLLWIGTGDEGINIWDPDSEILQTYRIDPLEERSLISDHIRVIYEDRDGGLWIGTRSEGISYWSRRNKQFVHFKHAPDHPNSLSASSVSSFFEGASGEIWIGTLGGGLNLFDRKTQSFKHYRNEPGNEHSLGNDITVSVIEDSKGNVWVLNSKWGVSKFDPRVSPPRFKHYRIRFVMSIFEDKRGDLWLGAGFGINRYDPVSDRFVFCQENVEPGAEEKMTSVWSIYEDRERTLWFGSFEGLFYYNRADDRFVKFPIRDKKQDPAVETPIYVINEDRQGNLWLGGNDGLRRIDPRTGKVATWGKKDGLADDMIHGIVEDDRGMIWISTAKGLSKFNPETRKFRNYDRLDGLQSDEFNQGAFLKTGTGELFFGGINGFNVFHPDSIKDVPHFPPVVITDFLLDKKSVAIKDTPGDTMISKHNPLFQSITHTDELILPYWLNDFSFEFAALNYLHPEKNRYKYRLEGYDEGWIETDADLRVATYTNLSPDTYTFRVIGTNNDGIWNMKGDRVTLTIRAPWYWNFWSKGFYLLLLISGIYAVYQFLLNRRLAVAEAHRLKELDAIKTRLYTNITHEFRTPLTIIKGMAEQEIDEKGQLPPEKNLENAQMIRRNSDRLLRLVNQMLDLRKLESGAMPVNMINGDLLAYLKYIVESFHSYAESKKIQLQFQTRLEEFRMDYDPEKLMNILSNLISNAIKFTPEGGKVEVVVGGAASAERTRSAFRNVPIQVKDTGIGIPPEKQAHIFDRFYQVEDESTRTTEGTGIGLALTGELVKLLKGELTMRSTPGEGTEFTIVLPVTNQAPAEFSANRDAVKDRIAPFIATSGKLYTPSRLAKPASGDLPLALIIEDNEEMVQYLSSCLEGDYRLQVARNGQEGINSALEVIPDIIVSDVMMPGKDGFEVCRTLKKNERSSHIPIVLLTAKADMESKLEGLQRGADAYLPKPFHKGELLIRLQKLLELRKKLRQYYLSIAAGNGEDTPEEKTLPGAEIEDKFVQKVREVVEAHLGDWHFNVSDLCKKVAMSHSQLHRKLTALTGYSTNRFIRFIRLSEAKRLLSESDHNISEVAYQTGFRDPVYFTRVFGKEFGMTPSAFRKKRKDGP